MDISDLLPPSLVYETRRMIRYFLELLSRISIWRWEISAVPIKANSFNSLLYVGRRKRKVTAMQIMGILNNPDKKIAERVEHTTHRVIVSEFPFPDALCVPTYLSIVLPIDRPLDELLENIGNDKLRFFQKFRKNYRVERIAEDAEIDRIDKTMLRPFAAHRYGKWALHFSYSKIRNIARNIGALNLIYYNDKEVACSLGAEIIRKGKRYWQGERSGFPAQIFTHGKTFGEVNSMNYYLEIEWACVHGYDFYSLGVSLARPENTVLQWKRRLRGHLDTMGNYYYFYIRPPKTGTSNFFWEAPLFSLEKGKITLNFGKPKDQSDEAFIKRFREMGFGGLSNICLHCEHPPSKDVLSAIASIYDRFENPPSIKIRHQG